MSCVRNSGGSFQSVEEQFERKLKLCLEIELMRIELRYKEFEKFPERHPNYCEEQKKFWEQLNGVQGMDTSGKSKEMWTDYFLQHMKKCKITEIEKKREEVERNNNLIAELFKVCVQKYKSRSTIEILGGKLDTSTSNEGASYNKLPSVDVINQPSKLVKLDIANSSVQGANQGFSDIPVDFEGSPFGAIEKQNVLQENNEAQRAEIDVISADPIQLPQNHSDNYVDEEACQREGVDKSTATSLLNSSDEIMNSFEVCQEVQPESTQRCFDAATNDASQHAAALSTQQAPSDQQTNDISDSFQGPPHGAEWGDDIHVGNYYASIVPLPEGYTSEDSVLTSIYASPINSNVHFFYVQIQLEY